MSDTGSLQIVLGLNKEAYTAGMKQVQAQLGQFSNASQRAGHASVSSTQAASASLRLLQGDFTNNIRAVEQFIGKTLGLGDVLKAAFPVVGAVAFGALLVKMGDDVVKFIQQVNQAPKALQAGFQSLNLSQQSANDALAVTNDKLAQEIAKLENKPQNQLKLALDESRVAADQLATSLQRDREQISQLLTQQHVSFGGMLASRAANGKGQASTSDVAGSVNSYETKLSDLGYQFSEAIRTGNKELSDALQKQINDTRASAHQYAQTGIASRKVSQSQFRGYDQSANINILEGFDTSLSNEEQNERETAQNKALTEQKAGDDAKIAAARAAAAAMQKQQEQLIEQWRSQLDALKAAQDMTVSQEATFWIDRAATTTFGSKSYQTALDEANKNIATIRAENARAEAEFSRTAAQPTSQGDQTKEYQPWMQSQGSAAAEYLKNLNDGVNIQQANANAFAEASIQQQVAAGTMSTYGAAVAEAQLHTAEYNQELTKLQDALKAIAADPTLTAIQRQAQAAGINNQISELNGSRSIQSMQDQSGILDQTDSQQFRQAINEFVNASQELGKSIGDLTASTLKSFNSDIMNGKGFRQTTANALKGAGEAGLSKAEGGLLGAFGFGSGGKLGTQSNPMYVRMAANGIGSGAALGGSGITKSIGGFLGGLFGKGKSTGGDSSSDINKSIANLADTLFGNSKQTANPDTETPAKNTSLGDHIFGGIFGGVSKVGGYLANHFADKAFDSLFSPTSGSGGISGAFAAGGDPTVDQPALIGEEGPELFVPHTSGTIIPNNKLGGSSPHYDFSGANFSGTDPVQTKSMIKQAMKETQTRSVASSLAASKDRASRRPSNSKS